MEKKIIIKDTTIALFKNNVKSLREQIEKYIISVMEAHNVNSIDCCYVENCPVVIDGVSFDTDYSTYTLDTINLYSGNNGKYISFNCSNNCSRDSINLNKVDIERLIDICEWVKANENELFDVVD